MSVILDALRKSEAERQRGQSPGLHNELPPLTRAPPHAPSRWAWPVGGGMAALGVAALAVGWMLRPEPPVAAGVAPAPSAPVVRPVVTPTVTPSAPVSASVAPLPVATAAPVRPAPAQPAAPTIAMPTPAPVVATAAPAPAAITPPPAVDLPDPPTPVAEADTGNAVRLADLPSAQREQLPALKISMHMWDAAAARRFAIIDGNRLSEGDRIGEAVVSRITPDGVILDWHGQRLSLPIR